MAAAHDKIMMMFGLPPQVHFFLPRKCPRQQDAKAIAIVCARSTFRRSARTLRHRSAARYVCEARVPRSFGPGRFARANPEVLSDRLPGGAS